MENNEIFLVVEPQFKGILYKIAQVLDKNISQVTVVYAGIGLKKKIICWFLNRFFYPKTSYESDIIYYFPYYLIGETQFKGKVKVSLLTHYEKSDVFKKQKWIKSLKESDYLVAISDFVKFQAIEMGVSRRKILTIRYGASDFYKPKINILVVGECRERKGVDFLTKTVRILNYSQEVEFDLRYAGGGWPSESHYKDNRNLSEAYSWADVLFVPSTLEGGHTPTIEALFSGKQVVTRPVGWSYSELFDVVNIVHTPKEAANRIKKIFFSKNKKSTRRKLEKYFSQEKWIKDHKNLFNVKCLSIFQ